MHRTRGAAAAIALVVSALALGASTRAFAAETMGFDLIARYGLEESATPVREHPGWRKPRRMMVGGMAAGALDDLRQMTSEVEFIGPTANLANVDAILGWCPANLITAATSIRWVQTTSAGVEDCVSIPAIRERNIVLTNAQRLAGPVMSEHVIAMMLALTRGLDLHLAAQREGEWGGRLAQRRPVTISGKTMLVVGLGGIGTDVAKRAHALGMRVIATRNSSREGPEFVSHVGLPQELLKLTAEADVVVNTAPLTPQTTGLFDAAYFAAMKPGAYFINVARGGSVVTNALVDALNKGQLAGAGLDVTDPEPLPPSHPLWRARNVIITPHVSNDSELGIGVRMEVLKENVRRYIAGDRLLSVVDVKRGY
jgi:phosphoglycerate dehydrogenase-like enzyme